jgi:HK97 gp10 family phage protein
MASDLTIDVDDAALLAALDAIPDAVRAHAKPAARVTADHIAAEAGRRIARRTGQTAGEITVEETHAGDGYVVFVGAGGAGRSHVGRYLEFGTVHMRARPFLFPSAQLEAGAHDRRMRDAVQDAIDEHGLGE